MHELHKDDTHKPQMYRPEITSKRSASRFSHLEKQCSKSLSVTIKDTPAFF